MFFASNLTIEIWAKGRNNFIANSSKIFRLNGCWWFMVEVRCRSSIKSTSFISFVKVLYSHVVNFIKKKNKRKLPHVWIYRTHIMTCVVLEKCYNWKTFLKIFFFVKPTRPGWLMIQMTMLLPVIAQFWLWLQHYVRMNILCNIHKEKPAKCRLFINSMRSTSCFCILKLNNIYH